MSLQTLLWQRATHQRRVTGQGEGGGMTAASWSTLAAGLACNVQSLTTAVREQYARKRLFVDSEIYFDRDVAAQVNDRFVVDGKTLIVRGYGSDEAGRPGRGAPYVALVEEQPAVAAGA